jgi:hypothetical protein
MLDYSIKELDKIFPGKGLEYSQDLTRFVSKQCPGRANWDFLLFRKQFKEYLGIVLIACKNDLDGFSDVLTKTGSFYSVLELDHSEWSPKHYKSLSHLRTILEEKPNELRKSLYKCTRCAKHKEYAFNNTFYELQTRSSDVKILNYFLLIITFRNQQRFSLHV